MHIFIISLFIVPQLLSHPEVSSVSAVILNVTWLPPVYPNGNITSYSLDVVSSVDEHTLIYSADTTSAILNDLKAFTEYTVFVTAFNVIGNVTSEGTVIMTGETSQFKKKVYSIIISLFHLLIF